MGAKDPSATVNPENKEAGLPDQERRDRTNRGPFDFAQGKKAAAT